MSGTVFEAVVVLHGQGTGGPSMRTREGSRSTRCRGSNPAVRGTTVKEHLSRNSRRDKMAKKAGAASRKGARKARVDRGARRSAGHRRSTQTRAMTLQPREARPSDPSRHVVLLMLENRSFDQMLGALQPAVPDLDGVPAGGSPRSNPDVLGQRVE